MDSEALVGLSTIGSWKCYHSWNSSNHELFLFRNLNSLTSPDELQMFALNWNHCQKGMCPYALKCSWKLILTRNGWFIRNFYPLIQASHLQYISDFTLFRRLVISHWPKGFSCPNAKWWWKMGWILPMPWKKGIEGQCEGKTPLTCIKLYLFSTLKWQHYQPGWTFPSIGITAIRNAFSQHPGETHHLGLFWFGGHILFICFEINHSSNLYLLAD